MDDKERIIDQSQLAEDLSSKIHFEMTQSFLVKPLDPIMVKKEFSEPVGDTPTDKDGVEAVDYKEVKTEVREVESDYKRGVVLKVPYEYTQMMNTDKYQAQPIKIGDIIIYKYGKWFDVLKDTQLVKSYDIVAIEETV